LKAKKIRRFFVRQGKKLVLGLAPTRRNYSDTPAAEANKNRINEFMKSFAQKEDFELVTIEDINEQGFAKDIPSADKIIEKFRRQGVNALFFPHCNFGQEEACLRIARDMGLPLLLWGPRDPAPNGLEWRDTDTQCGLFATSKAFYRLNIPFTYIENSPIDSPVFTKNLKEFIRTARIVHALKHARILQISARPREFLSVMVDESDLLERFGVEVMPVTANNILAKVEEFKKDSTGIAEILEGYAKKGIDLSKLDKGYRENMAALELAINAAAEELGCGAAASECWEIFGASLGIRPCAVFGNLGDRGLPAACENDIHGALSCLIGLAANNYREPVFLADLTQRHPTNDNAELLWHCGPFPKGLKKESGHAFINDGMGQWQIKDGEMTILRFDGCRQEYRLFAGLCKTVEGPLTNGNYCWIETDNWPSWEKKFIQGPYIHHVTGVYGNYTQALEEACKYIRGLDFDSPAKVYEKN
jgi:L-fucose isomerase-like protein